MEEMADEFVALGPLDIADVVVDEQRRSGGGAEAGEAAEISDGLGFSRGKLGRDEDIGAEDGPQRRKDGADRGQHAALEAPRRGGGERQRLGHGQHRDAEGRGGGVLGEREAEPLAEACEIDVAVNRRRRSLSYPDPQIAASTTVSASSLKAASRATRRPRS